MKAFFLIKQNAGVPILPEDFLTARETGEMVEKWVRDKIYNTVDILDPDTGDPTGETKEVFDRWGPRYQDGVVPKKIGGFSFIGNVKGWGAFLVYGTQAMLVELDGLPGVLGIARKKDLLKIVSPVVRTKINTWLTNNSFPNFPATWTNKKLIRELFRRFFSDYELRKFDKGKDDPDEEDINISSVAVTP